MIMALYKLQNCRADSKTFLEYYSCFSKADFPLTRNSCRGGTCRSFIYIPIPLFLFQHEMIRMLLPWPGIKNVTV